MASETITVEIKLVRRSLIERIFYWPKLWLIDYRIISEHYKAPLLLRLWVSLRLSLTLLETKVVK